MLLEAQRLRKSFGGLHAVDEVDFAVEAGSITGIIGPNGAGKTTFFNLISRALPVTSGRILFDGYDVTTLQPHDISRRGVARTTMPPSAEPSSHAAAGSGTEAENASTFSMPAPKLLLLSALSRPQVRKVNVSGPVYNNPMKARAELSDFASPKESTLLVVSIPSTLL